MGATDTTFTLAHAEHRGDVGSRTARNALEYAVGCARTVLEVIDTKDLPESIASLPEGSRERQAAINAYDDELQQKAIVNGIAALLHLGSAIVYAIEDAGQAVASQVPYAGKGT